MKDFKNKLTVFEKIVFYLLVLFLPSQLGYHYWPNHSFIFGIRVDYLSPTIFFTDILVFILLTLFILREGKSVLLKLGKYKAYILIFLSLAVLNTIFSLIPLAAIFKWLKVIEVLALGFYISQNLSLIKNKVFSNLLSVSLIAISLLGISQFFKGATLGGLFYFIGERSFSLATPGIALQSFLGQDYLRAYSSFSHPNSLAGYLFIFTFILLVGKQKNVIQKLALVLSLITLVLTFSLTVFVTIVVSLLLYFLYKRRDIFWICLKTATVIMVLFSLSLAFIPENLSGSRFFNKPEVEERIKLAKVSKTMFLQSPIIGKGLNNFVINLPQVQDRSQYFWFLQPVHNVVWFLLSEVGIVGLLLFLCGLFKIKKIFSLKKNYLGAILLFAIFFISSFDHYFFTLQQNMLSLSFALTAAFTLKKA